MTTTELERNIGTNKPDPYTVCPTYESDSFLLRFVSMDDAGDLMECYGSAQAQKLFNADNCTSDFCFSSVEALQSCMALWLSEYEKGKFVRFSIIDKVRNKAVGTIEIFGGKHGVLRIDLAPRYENHKQLSELLSIADSFFADFKCDKIVTKAIPEAGQRIAALTANGYAPYPKSAAWNGLHYYMKSGHTGNTSTPSSTHTKIFK